MSDDLNSKLRPPVWLREWLTVLICLGFPVAAAWGAVVAFWQKIGNEVSVSGWLILLSSAGVVTVVCGLSALVWKQRKELVRVRRFSPRLRIHSAVYARDQAQVDVTEVLNKKVVADSLTVVASNDLAGDPCHGFQKTLTVDFCFDGTRTVRMAKEGSELKLP